MGSDSTPGRTSKRPLSIEDLVHRRLQEHRSELVGRSAALGSSPTDEDVHQARVAVRRLRSDVRLFAPFLEPSPTERLRPELQWIASTLGRIRDLDVLGELLTARVSPGSEHDALAQLLAPIAAERDRSVTQLADTTESDRFAGLMDMLEGFATRPPLRSGRGLVARDAMPKLVRLSWRRLRRAAVAIERGAPPEEFHRVRILTKRARYAVEAVDGLGFPKSRTLARRLTGLQDHLGRLNDHVVAGAWLRAHGPELDDPSAAYAAGELTATVRHEIDRLVDTWHEPWERVDRRSLRRWF